ncbi:MAG: hypothetical protein Homavirus3_11 [Homavirus sp.]|uniref:Uncharacterized protein n=1 Tax=Homavirus sp. TaxID=2487769 RepID=A0A3G5A876_9VIRU|nr:MAG: hypothetical protein Homavirus3_11 [Homavirus sp.]
MDQVAKLPQVKSTDSNITSNIKSATPAIIIGSLVFINGLIWNDTFNAIINYYVPDKYKKSDNVLYRVLYATIMTIIMVIIISLIIKYSPN